MNLEKISKGDKFPEELNVIVEIPRDSSVKYELEKDPGAVFVDRFMFTAMVYPANYGFIPHTKADDGDPIDVLVLSPKPVHPGSVLPARPVGILEMEDEKGVDHKVLAVPPEKLDPWHKDVQDIKDVNQATLDQIKHFFEHMKELEPGKWVEVKEFHGKERALEELKKSA